MMTASAPASVPPASILVVAGQWRCMIIETPRMPSTSTGKWLKMPYSPKKEPKIRTARASAVRQALGGVSSSESARDAVGELTLDESARLEDAGVARDDWPVSAFPSAFTANSR